MQVLQVLNLQLFLNVSIRLGLFKFMSKRYIRMLLTWLNIFFKKAIFRSRKIFLTILRLFRRCHEVASGVGERTIRNHSLALSTQPSNQEQLPGFVAVSLAVPLESGASKLELSTQLSTSGIVDGRSNGEVSYAQNPYDITSCAMPEPSIILPQSAEAEQYSDITLTPIIPAEIKRYDRNVTISRQYMIFKIKKGFSSYEEELPSGSRWQEFTHPEGALFFYHPEKRVFTDADVRKPEVDTKMSRAADKALKEALKANVAIHPSMELGLELMEDGQTGYYFADCTRRVVFWFEDNRSQHLMKHVRGVEHMTHIRYAVEAQYWKHIELFPNKRFLPKDDVAKLKGIVMHSVAENITSDTCLAPFDLDEIGNMLTLMDPLSSSINEEHEHAVCIVARFMRLFCDSKFVNFCGQPGARLDADKPLYGDPSARSKHAIYRFMNIILFGSPGAHSKSIHRIWVDKIILQPRWTNFINRLNSEWNGYTIFSTVMLAVNISFLAVPAIQNQTAAIIPAYMSTLFAMGSLMVSLVLAGQVNDSRRNDAEGVASFMDQMSKSLLGLDSLAIMLSLPFALLIWGMIHFWIALSILIFSTSGTVTISVISPTLSAVAILSIWPVIASFGVHPTTWRARLIERLMGEPPGVGTSDGLPK